MGQSEEGSISNVEFSAVSDTVYYYSEITEVQSGTNNTTLAFYRGTTTSPPVATGLTLLLPGDPESYTPRTWHVLAAD
jgi:hypothetical protein